MAQLMAHQFWIEFLQLYKENTCLWDVKSSLYMRRDLRNASYNVLLNKYKEIDPAATLDMVKKKIDIFRTGFRREQRKINESRENCTSPEMEYKPTLWYFDALTFLDFQAYEQDHKYSIIKESNDSDDHNAEPETTIEYIDIPDDYTSRASTPNPVINYRMKRRKLENKQSQRLETAPSSSYFPIEEDDCSIYCASLKLQMRELDTEQKYIAQKLISDVIFLARTSQLTLDSTINTQPF